MNWFIVDKEYVNYLSQFDEKVGFVEYGNRCCNFKLLEQKSVEY